MRNKPYPLYEVDEINNLKELVNLAAEKYGDKPAFTFERDKETVSVSYRQFKIDVEALGTALHDMSIQNTRIAVIGENSYEWILTYFATVNSGNIIVPIDKELSATDIKNIVDTSGASVFVFSVAYSDVAEYLRENGVSIKHYISMDDLRDLLEKGDYLVHFNDDSVVTYEVDNHALAALLYTSGTTGTAKGVMLSHCGITHNAIAASQFIEMLGCNLLVLPLHHSFGLTAGVCAMFYQGSEIFINSSLKNILSDLVRYKPYNLCLVPLFVETFYKKIWDSSKKQGKDGIIKKLISVSNALLKVGIDLRRVLFRQILKAFGGNLKYIVCGGASLDTKYIKGLRDFGINVLNGYGITECSPIVAANRNKHYRDGSTGRVLPYCDVKIIEPDENGNGEICVKGDIVMLGYYNNEQATAEAFDGEWFKTGDIGYLDNDGFLFITGRKKNLIVLSNGKNVYPEEIELVLLNIPLIKEVIVREDTSEKGNTDVIIAEIFPNYDAAKAQGADDLHEYFDKAITDYNKTVPSYQHIQRVILRDTEFIKTTTKKIKRNTGA